jgi:hypothetical protein
MKSISARTTDLRDVFMLASISIERKKLLQMFSEFNLPLKQKQKIIAHANSKDF